MLSRNLPSSCVHSIYYNQPPLYSLLLLLLLGVILPVHHVGIYSFIVRISTLSSTISLNMLMELCVCNQHEDDSLDDSPNSLQLLV